MDLPSHHFSSLGGCGDIDGRREDVVFVEGGERGDDRPHRRRWVAVALGGGGSVGNALHSLQLEEQIVPQSACVNTLTGICQLHRMTGKSQDTLIKCFALIAIGDWMSRSSLGPLT